MISKKSIKYLLSYQYISDILYDKYNEERIYKSKVSNLILLSHIEYLYRYNTRLIDSNISLKHPKLGIRLSIDDSSYNDIGLINHTYKIYTSISSSKISSKINKLADENNVYLSGKEKRIISETVNRFNKEYNAISMERTIIHLSNKFSKSNKQKKELNENNIVEVFDKKNVKSVYKTKLKEYKNRKRGNK